MLVSALTLTLTLILTLALALTLIGLPKEDLEGMLLCL